MPRKGRRDRVDEEHFENQVVEVFRKTAPQERFEIARAWCVDFTLPTALSAALGLPPIVLLVASMIDIRHPLVSSERPYVSLTTVEADIMRAAVRGAPLAIPVCPQNLPTGGVDSMCTVVDNCRFILRNGAGE
jgi:hypothetical protein